MEKFEILEILTEWNFWKEDMEVGIFREYYVNEILDRLKLDKVISVIGVRRSGKSTILKQIVKKLIEKNMRENTLIVNFEDRRWLKLDLEFLNKVYDAYQEIIKPRGKPYIFLDEIQKVEKWERFVRSLNERKEANILITGSSSELMSKELSSLLTGRTLEIEIFPLSFKEFLKFKKLRIKDERDMAFNAAEIRSLFIEYLEFGGFPEIVLVDDKRYKREILWQYFDDIIGKDVIERFNIRNSRKIEILAKYYLTNISSPHTFNSISRFLKIPVETISRYSNYLEISRLISFLKRFSFSLKEQENSPRKVYSIDIGLSNAIGFRFREDFGKIAENIVFLELKRREMKSKTEIFYWKDSYGKEVDFVVKDDTSIKELIQVCWDISKPNTKERELKALVKAGKELKCRNLKVITWDYEGREEFKGKEIRFIPLWRWLLG